MNFFSISKYFLENESYVRLEFWSNIKLEKERISKFLLSSITDGLRVCIDLSLDNEHSDRERRSLCRQLTNVYMNLKKQTYPISLHFSYLNGKVLEMMKFQGIQNWVVNRYEESAWDIFPHQDMIFLSPDATDVLTTFDMSKVKRLNHL